MRSKYGNRKVEYAGYTFDSQAEYRRYQQLLLLERAGEIRNLEVHPSYLLQPAFKAQGRAERAIEYRADFEYFDVADEVVVVEEVKGAETAVWKLKRKLFLFKFHEWELRVIAAKDV